TEIYNFCGWLYISNSGRRPIAVTTVNNYCWMNCFLFKIGIQCILGFIQFTAFFIEGFVSIYDYWFSFYRSINDPVFIVFDSFPATVRELVDKTIIIHSTIFVPIKEYLHKNFIRISYERLIAYIINRGNSK